MERRFAPSTFRPVQLGGHGLCKIQITNRVRSFADDNIILIIAQRTSFASNQTELYFLIDQLCTVLICFFC